MTDRRAFLKQALLPAGALCLPSMITVQAPQAITPRTAESPLSHRLKSFSRDTMWNLVTEIKVRFKTFHCQGMVKIGDEFWVSSVEVGVSEDGLQDRSKGKGHLFRIDSAGNLLADVAIGEGSIFHPSGIDFDGSHIWIAAAEYRPDSRSIIYKFDPRQKTLQEVFRWEDHIGGIARDKETNTLHGISWGSRRFYTWPLDEQGNVRMPAGSAILNPSFYIDYQDLKCLGGHEMLYTGLSVYKRPGGQSLPLGGLEIVDLEKACAVHQVPVQLWSPVTGAVMTQNPSFFELMPDERVRAYFIPDDNVSTIFVYEA
ncbi:MAG: hypothetical protein J0H74_13635 [Chitinophagaceae bacterium]|nr:hypothetical protein [Chitinophagaceae bacterium]